MCARISRINPTWPIRTVASEPDHGRERPIGERDHLGVGSGPAGTQQLDSDLVEFAQPHRAGVALVAEDRARAAHPPGQGRALARLGERANDARRQLGAEANPRRPARGQLEELGDDARAAFALVQLGEFEDRRPDRLVSGLARSSREAAARAPPAARSPRGSQSRVPRTSPTAVPEPASASPRPESAAGAVICRPLPA